MVSAHVRRLQSYITLLLFGLLTILIAIKIILPGVNVESQFSIIAGWLGIIIGFFFNQQFVDHFHQKYTHSEKTKEDISFAVSKTLTEQMLDFKKTEEKYQKQITKLNEELIKIKNK
ncbi:hypothetical protein HOC01_04405 [archaeon]|jgi:hypothetical protein|nr:hypothetical protein [archaeon]MBT6698346.1 hypothetical protein [archaeon]